MSLPNRIEGTDILPAFAWPGGYPIVYYTKDGLCVCPGCANDNSKESDPVVDADINWEDTTLNCDDCGHPIEPAYPP